MEYTRRDLAQAVLDAHPASKRGLDMFYGGFSKDKKEHQVRVRDGLLKAFGVDLKADMAFWMLLRSTVESNATITAPLEDFGEAGLIIRKIEGTGILGQLNDIVALNARSKQAHLDIVDELIGLLGPSVETVTSDDLEAIGVDDTPPNRNDYEMDY